MVWSDAPPFPDTTSCTYGERYSNYSCPTGYTPNSTVTNCTATPTKTCPAPCFTLNAATGRCDFTGGTNASCYTCPASTLNYTGTSYQIYSTTVSGNQCPIKEPGVLNASPLSPSPWGNNSLFDGNTGVGLSYLLTKLGNVNNFTTRDGSVKCYPGKVCTNVTLTSGPSNGTAVTAGADCPAGYYCTSIDTAPIVCPLGSYCPAGASLPTACSSGSYCVAGSSSQTPCPAGYWCQTGNLKTPCLPGTYSASTGASSASTCLVCPAGSYCPSGSASATTCPVGNFCPMGSGALNTCDEGYYCPTTTAKIRCPGATTCPAGTSSNYGIVCDRTTVPNGAYSGCSACPNPAAYYIWDPAYATSPTAIILPPATTIDGPYEPIRFRSVTVNNFNFIAGKSILATSGGLKLTGTVLSSTASELVITVNGYSGTGTSSTAWTITPFGCDTVVKCQGHMKSSADFTKCEGCPLPAAGFIWAGSSGCETVQCTDGMFPNTDLTTCTNLRSTIATCMTNTQCAAGQTCGTNGRCTACAPGTACATCPTSTPFWDGVACMACPSGQYWNGTACTACAACADGTYETGACTSATNRVCSTCATCASGTYETGACTATTNRVCSTCTACADGTYETGACTSATNRVCSTCATCVSGTYETGACTATTNRVCSACASPCVSGMRESTSCTATTNRVCSACASPCSPGTIEVIACTATTNRVCSTCDPGTEYYCPDGVSLPRCSYPSSTQYVTAVCSSRYDTQFGTKPSCSGNQSLIGFSAGSYNALGTPGTCSTSTVVSCTTAAPFCSAGNYLTGLCYSNGYDDRRCQACPETSYCNGGLSAPIPCPVLNCPSGQYKVGGCRGTLGNTQYCEVCPFGAYCPGDNQLYACPTITCSAGTYVTGTCSATTNSRTCSTCVGGNYCPGDGGMYTCPASITCPAGQVMSTTSGACTATGDTRTCVACATGATCASCVHDYGSQYPIWSGSACVACTDSSHCPVAGSSCTNNMCVVTACRDSLVNITCNEGGTGRTAAITLSGGKCTTVGKICGNGVKACGTGLTSGLAYTLSSGACSI